MYGLKAEFQSFGYSGLEDVAPRVFGVWDLGFRVHRF